MSDQGDDRAEIEDDIRAQGLEGEVTYEDVASTFGLHETTEPFDEYGPEPSPAEGPDWRYTPEPGEESLFASPERTD